METPKPLLDQLDLPGIEAFLTVAQEGSVLRAADRLGRTQPSISARLTALEARWKVVLFRRTGRGMQLTPEGRRRLALVEQAWRSLRSLNEALYPDSTSAEWRLGAGDALGRRLLPQLLRKALIADRSLQIRVEEGPGERLLERLKDGVIDVAWIPEDDRPRGHSGLIVKRLLDSAVCVLCPVDHPRKRFKVEHLHSERLVSLPEGSSFRRWLEQNFADRGVSLSAEVEVGSLSLVRRFVAAGLGLAVVPAIAFDPKHEAGSVRMAPLLGIPKVRYLSATRKGAPKPPFVSWYEQND